MGDARSEIIAWDVGNWAPALNFWEEHGALGERPLECLEIGANKGGLSLWLAQRGHRVLCTDLENSEANAKPLLERHGVLDRVSFEDIDATEIPYRERFDVIVFKSVLGGIGHDDSIARQRKAMESMYAALRPGGRLLFAENLRGSPLHRYFRKRFISWGNRWRYVSSDEMRAFLSPFRHMQFRTTGFFGAFGRRESQRRLLSSFDRLAVNALVPASWHYVIYGVAQK